MSKRQFLILLGVWVMIFLFLGFPPEWDKVFSIIVGLLIVIIAIGFRSATKTVSSDRVSFVEHRSSQQPRPTSTLPPTSLPRPDSATIGSDSITNTDKAVS